MSHAVPLMRFMESNFHLILLWSVRVAQAHPQITPKHHTKDTKGSFMFTTGCGTWSYRLNHSCLFAAYLSSRLDKSRGMNPCSNNCDTVCWRDPPELLPEPINVCNMEKTAGPSCLALVLRLLSPLSRWKDGIKQVIQGAVYGEQENWVNPVVLFLPPSIESTVSGVMGSLLLRRPVSFGKGFCGPQLFEMNLSVPRRQGRFVEYCPPPMHTLKADPSRPSLVSFLISSFYELFLAWVQPVSSAQLDASSAKPQDLL